MAYLDEFGHIGPYVDRSDSKHHGSPVFGLAGLVLPAAEVRGFGTWFFQQKCALLSADLARSGKHPAVWEKKGADLYTAINVARYRQLRVFTNRFFNRIARVGGFVLYVGLQKTQPPGQHNANALYAAVLVEAIKRIDEFCVERSRPADRFLLVLDEHDQRSALLTKASQRMYGGDEPRRQLIEPPFQAESHRYQTVQAADWICGLVGRIGAFRAKPGSYAQNEVFVRYFGERLNRVSRRSGIRIDT